MNAICGICSDFFEDLNSISAAPCGHVYHTNCLNLWIAKSKTCPECRSKTYFCTIRKLYFNAVPNPDLNSLDLENKIAYLTAQLSAKDEELEAYEKEKEEIIAFMRDADKKVCDMKKYVLKLVKEVKEKAETVPKLEAGALTLENKNAILDNYPKVKTAYSCTSKDVKGTLKDYRDYLNPCLKQELLEAVNSKGKLQYLNCKFKRENRTHAAEKLRDDAMKLRNRVFQEKTTSHQMLTPWIDSNEENPLVSTTTKSKVSTEKEQIPASMILNKKTISVHIKASGSAYCSASSSQNKIEFTTTVSARKKSRY